MSTSPKVVDLSDSRPRRRPRGGAATGILHGEIARYDENKRARGREWRGRPDRLGTAQKMLTNPYVGAARDGLVLLIARGTWGFEPGGDSDEAREAAKYQEWCWFQCLPWVRYVARMLRNTYTYGFSVEEMTDDSRPLPAGRFPNHPLGTSGIVPTGLHERPAWSIEKWNANPAMPTELASVEQSLIGSDVEDHKTVTIPADRLIRVVWEQEGANFEGVAQQRRALGPWYTVRLLEKIELLVHNKVHQPIPVLTRGPNALPQDDDLAQTAVQRWQAGEDMVLTLPDGYTINFVAPNPGTEIRTTIDSKYFDIMSAADQGFMIHGAKNKTGSRALAEVQRGHGVSKLDVLADNFADAFNFGNDGWAPVRRIHELNYGPDVPAPRLTLRHLPNADLEALKLLFQAAELGIIRVGPNVERHTLGKLRGPAPEDPAEGRFLNPQPQPDARTDSEPERVQEDTENA